jgi:hypothetical protein
MAKSKKQSTKAKASKSTKTPKPAKSAKASKASSKASKTAKTAKTVKTAKTAKAKSAKTAKAAKPGKTAKTAKTTKAAKPAKATKKKPLTTRSSKPGSDGSKGSSEGRGDAKSPSPVPPAKRKLGLRGAAPWAARHAAKHAAEARARAAEPAPPGSARATIRVPSGAEEIKAKIAELHNQTQKIRTLRKRLDKSFFEIGQVLWEVQQHELYQAKGYGSFEAFLERETDLGKQTAVKLIKISQVFQPEAALDYGMDRCIMALNALEGDTVIPKAPAPSAPGSKPPLLPLKPPPMRSVM